jgi:hypothetical protein
MGVCVCCNRERAEVKIRVGLRTLDTLGKTTTKPFHGPLCDDCLIRVTRNGSVEQRWLLQQILRTEPENEFEHDIHDAFLRQDLSAVMNNCEKYERRFRALGEEED